MNCLQGTSRNRGKEGVTAVLTTYRVPCEVPSLPLLLGPPEGPDIWRTSGGWMGGKLDKQCHGGGGLGKLVDRGSQRAYVSPRREGSPQCGKGKSILVMVII